MYEQLYNKVSFKLQTVVGVGAIYRWGEQKLVKNNQDSQIQNITLCDMFFFRKKSICGIQWGVGQSLPSLLESGEFSRIFVLKVCLHCVRLLLTVSYRNNLTTAVLSQGQLRDAAVNFGTYRSLQRPRTVSLPLHSFLVQAYISDSSYIK